MNLREKKALVQQSLISSMKKGEQRFSTPGGINDFIVQGNDINARLANGTTPLMNAVWGSRVTDTAVKWALEKGADPNIAAVDSKDWVPEGATALHAAAIKGSAKIVSRLLSAGADPKVLSEEGKTPLDYARERGIASIIKLLESGDPSVKPLAPITDGIAGPSPDDAFMDRSKTFLQALLLFQEVNKQRSLFEASVMRLMTAHFQGYTGQDLEKLASECADFVPKMGKAVSDLEALLVEQPGTVEKTVTETQAAPQTKPVANAPAPNPKPAPSPKPAPTPAPVAAPATPVAASTTPVAAPVGKPVPSVAQKAAAASESIKDAVQEDIDAKAKSVAKAVDGVVIPEENNEGRPKHVDIFQAVEHSKSLDELAAWLDSGDIFLPEELDKTDKRGQNAIFYALKSFDPPTVVKTLSDVGCEVSHQREDGATALHLATFLAHKDPAKHDVVAALVGAGARLDIKSTKQQFTPLDIAKKWTVQSNTLALLEEAAAKNG